MRQGIIKFYLAPYGSASRALQDLAKQDPPNRDWLRTAMRRPSGRVKDFEQLWVTVSSDLDSEFVKTFRQHAMPEARLLILNLLESKFSTDTLFSHLIDMQFRSRDRFHIEDCLGASPEQWSVALGTLVQRIAAGTGTDQGSDRILNANIADAVLHVISSRFRRLDIQLEKIPALAGSDPALQREFEIDEDGAFIYWPKLDVHLGWEQLMEIANPLEVFKAKQRSQRFNERYGEALQALREKEGIKPDEVPGLSEKQLARIERGECRITSNALEALSKAFKTTSNDLLSRIAERL